MSLGVGLSILWNGYLRLLERMLEALRQRRDICFHWTRLTSGLLRVIGQVLRQVVDVVQNRIAQIS